MQPTKRRIGPNNPSVGPTPLVEEKTKRGKDGPYKLILGLLFMCVLFFAIFQINDLGAIYRQHRQDPEDISLAIKRLEELNKWKRDIPKRPKPKQKPQPKPQLNNPPWQRKIRKYPPPLQPFKRIEQSHPNFWHEIAYLDTLPTADPLGLVYIMNSIFLPKSKMLTIFALTKEYLRPEHGLHAWPSRRIPPNTKRPDLYTKLPKTILEIEKPDEAINPPLYCVFAGPTTNSEIGPDIYYVSKVDYVPNWTTRDRYVNLASSILRCEVPIEELSNVNFDNAESSLTVVLTQRAQELFPKEEQEQGKAQNTSSSMVHIAISINIGQRSAIKLHTNSRPYLWNDNLMQTPPERQLTLCMPPMSEPLPFITENVAHHFRMGVDHIYIGTHFDKDKVQEYTDKLIERVRPWYDVGMITIWPHEQPWLGFTDKAKDHWLNQCLYYVKDRDAYTLSLDTDEFVLVNEFENQARAGKISEKPLLALLNTQKDKKEYCWLTFASFQVWKLWNSQQRFMIDRFTGREKDSQYTWSKVIWNNDVLWYTGYHAGGACTAQDHDWTQIINDWRESLDPQHVYRFDDSKEGRIWHYYNCRHIRIEPSDQKHRTPWSPLVNDTTMSEIYGPFIHSEFTRLQLPATYPDDKFDVMKTEYYLQHYGDGKSMAEWKQSVQ